MVDECFLHLWKLVDRLCVKPDRPLAVSSFANRWYGLYFSWLIKDLFLSCFLPICFGCFIRDPCALYLQGPMGEGSSLFSCRVHRLNCWCLDHRVLFPEDDPHSPFRRAPSIGFPSGGTFASGSMASEDDIDPLFHGPLGGGVIAPGIGLGIFTNDLS
ncbi:hypothetical protein GW17_00013364 [Ensete ventricosum]|nr:hypothetical protein GW17_00013364 [Ensete ventricosum]